MRKYIPPIYAKHKWLWWKYLFIRSSHSSCNNTSPSPSKCGEPLTQRHNIKSHNTWILSKVIQIWVTWTSSSISSESLSAASQFDPATSEWQRVMWQCSLMLQAEHFPQEPLHCVRRQATNQNDGLHQILYAVVVPLVVHWPRPEYSTHV